MSRAGDRHLLAGEKSLIAAHKSFMLADEKGCDELDDEFWHAWHQVEGRIARLASDAYDRQ